MTAALVTLAFLVSGWIALIALAGSLEGRLLRIGAALRRHSPPDQLEMNVPVRARYVARRSRAAVGRPQLRAAA
jgi:hypothetical protein